MQSDADALLNAGVYTGAIGLQVPSVKFFFDHSMIGLGLENDPSGHTFVSC